MHRPPLPHGQDEGSSAVQGSVWPVNEKDTGFTPSTHAGALLFPPEVALIPKRNASLGKKA